ncbi:hypothetical protein GCM10007919_14250 [Rhizobium indigoferae]|nr:hypothetical protein GCM10007919_14250 [Rhizobium indigoferae]
MPASFSGTELQPAATMVSAKGSARDKPLDASGKENGNGLLRTLSGLRRR